MSHLKPSPRHRYGGFSLIEFTAVLALMALLAGIVGVSVHYQVIKGKQNTAKTQIAQLADAVQTYFSDVGRYPSNDEGLSVLAQKSEKVAEPIIPQVPADPWDHPYQYLSPGPNGQPFAIICLGADGRPGGSGADGDISSENLRATPGK